MSAPPCTPRSPRDDSSVEPNKSCMSLSASYSPSALDESAVPRINMAFFQPTIDSPRETSVTGLNRQLNDTEERFREASARCAAISQEASELQQKVQREERLRHIAEVEAYGHLERAVGGVVSEEASQRSTILWCAVEGISHLIDVASALACITAGPGGSPGDGLSRGPSTASLTDSSHNKAGDLADAQEEIMALRRQLGRARHSRESFDALAIAIKPIAFAEEYHKEAAKRAEMQTQRALSERTILALEEEVASLRLDNQALARKVESAAAAQQGHKSLSGSEPVQIVGGLFVKPGARKQAVSTATTPSLSQPTPVEPPGGKPRIEYLFGGPNGEGLRPRTVVASTSTIGIGDIDVAHLLEKYASPAGGGAAAGGGSPRREKRVTPRSAPLKSRKSVGSGAGGATPRGAVPVPALDDTLNTTGGARHAGLGGGSAARRRTGSPKTPRVSGASAQLPSRRSASAGVNAQNGRAPSGHRVRGGSGAANRVPSPARVRGGVGGGAQGVGMLGTPVNDTHPPRRRPEGFVQRGKAAAAAKGQMRRVSLHRGSLQGVSDTPTASIASGCTPTTPANSPVIVSITPAAASSQKGAGNIKDASGVARSSPSV